MIQVDYPQRKQSRQHEKRWVLNPKGPPKSRKLQTMLQTPAPIAANKCSKLTRNR